MPVKSRRDASVRLSTSLVESLFEIETYLYPTRSSELDAVARGEKGNCAWHFDPAHPSEIAAFVEEATRLGLTASQRPRHVANVEAVEICATKPGEEWRAEVVAWVMETGPFAKSEASTYLRSRALGYTHEQAVQWVERCRHQSPVHLRDSIYLILPFATAKRIHAAKGTLAVQRSFKVATGGFSLRRDALGLVPRGFAIGRAAYRWVDGLFTFEPHRVLVAECTKKHRARLARSLLSPIDFWTGEQWSPKPRSSQ